MKDKNFHSYPVPPADMVLDLIRSAPEAEDSFCPFTSPIFARLLLSLCMQTMAAVAAPV